jgi:hypothetical protein
MITLKSVTIKNFLSVGAVAQTIRLDQAGLTLVLGENLDLGGNGNRNGVGKCLRAETSISVTSHDCDVVKRFEEFLSKRHP